MSKNILLSLLLFYPMLVFSQKDNPRTIKLPDVLEEVSGAWFPSPDSLWWLNDGGHAPILYCTNRKGQIIDELKIPGIQNRDWEDLTSDDKGNIYIGDFGNNQNKRKDLMIYIVNRYSKQVDSIEFRYADQRAFPPPFHQRQYDMEAFFYYQDSLHLFSKNKVRQNYMTRHYVLPAKPGNYVTAPVDSLIIKKRILTAAAISPDGKTVAMVGYNYGKFLGIFPWTKSSVFLFRDFSNNRFLQGKLKRKKAPGCLFPKQYEALDFIDENTLYIGSERLRMFRQKAKEYRITP